jgi:uncharacterized protein YndB with AHSA1/START domain
MTNDGTLQEIDGRQVLRYERRLAHPVERVWSALTEPAELVGWWGDADVELVEGGSFVMRWLNTDDQGNSSVMNATITRLEPPRLLETNGDIHGTLRWELSPDGGGSLLVFTSTLELAESDRAKVLAGWHVHLDHLEDALDGRPVDWARWNTEQRPRWAVHNERYEAALGSIA